MTIIKRILIAIDNSACSLRAAKKGFQLAQQLDADVGLVFVINRNKETISVDLDISPEESQTVLLKRAEETIQQVIRMYDGEKTVFRFTPEGFPKEEIISTALHWNADIVVMGTHGHTGLQHLLMGSVAEYVIRHFTRPVMVVPMKKEG